MSGLLIQAAVSSAGGRGAWRVAFWGGVVRGIEDAIDVQQFGALVVNYRGSV